MPIRYEEARTPKGAPLLKMHVSGLCTLDEASTLRTHIKPGCPYHRQRVLVVVAPGTEYTPDARKHFGEYNNDHHAMAVVVTSSIVRAAINLMTRFAGSVRNFRMFTAEAEALAWLDAVEA